MFINFWNLEDSSSTVLDFEQESQFFIENARMISAIELEGSVADTSIFDVIIGKLSYW